MLQSALSHTWRIEKNNANILVRVLVVIRDRVGVKGGSAWVEDSEKTKANGRSIPLGVAHPRNMLR